MALGPFRPPMCRCTIRIAGLTHCEILYSVLGIWVTLFQVMLSETRAKLFSPYSPSPRHEPVLCINSTAPTTFFSPPSFLGQTRTPGSSRKYPHFHCGWSCFCRRSSGSPVLFSQGHECQAELLDIWRLKEVVLPLCKCLESALCPHPPCFSNTNAGKGALHAQNKNACFWWHSKVNGTDDIYVL